MMMVAQGDILFLLAIGAIGNTSKIYLFYIIGAGNEAVREGGVSAHVKNLALRYARTQPGTVWRLFGSGK